MILNVIQFAAISVFLFVIVTGAILSYHYRQHRRRILQEEAEIEKQHQEKLAEIERIRQEGITLEQDFAQNVINEDEYVGRMNKLFNRALDSSARN